MIVELSETASNAVLNVLASMMDGGSIELVSPTDNLLAVLKLANPAARMADAGAIAFNPIGEEDRALARGQAVLARIRSADGDEILQCDVGDEVSDAVVKLSTTQISRNNLVRILSFTLAMP